MTWPDTLGLRSRMSQGTAAGSLWLVRVSLAPHQPPLSGVLQTRAALAAHWDRVSPSTVSCVPSFCHLSGDLSTKPCSPGALEVGGDRFWAHS